MSANVVRALAERFHQVHQLRRESVEIAAPPRGAAQLQPMGPLLWLEMTYSHGRRRETWDFSPRPWLAYSVPTLRQPRARLWVVGGGFEVGPRGFRNTREGVGLQRISVDEARRRVPSQWARYRSTHYGAEVTQAVEAEWNPPKAGAQLVEVGWMDAIAYETDRNDGDGLSPWRHEFKGDESPLICTGLNGRGLYFVGGSYSVLNGWLI